MATRPASSPRLAPEGFAAVFEATPGMLLVVRASDLVMLHANPAYLDGVGLEARDVEGRPLLDVFPDSPFPGRQDQARDLRSLIDLAVSTRTSQTVREHRYDIPSPDGFDVRFWDITWIPLVSASGAVDLLLHHAEDVTDLVRTRYALARIEQDAEESARRISRLSEVALALTDAGSLVEVEEIVVSRGTGVLGAAGGSIVTLEDDGGWRFTLSPALDERARAFYRDVPRDSPLPACQVARTGQPLMFATSAEGLAFHPVMSQVYELRGRAAWAYLPLVVGGEVLGALSVSWVEEHQVTPHELNVLQAFAAHCAQAVHRLRSADREQHAAEEIEDLAVALQQALLTPPPTTTSLEIDVRYRAADDVAQVGGDWYDAFRQPDGTLVVVIGDVVGHDAAAAGKMGQLRGLLRALAFDAAGRSTAHRSPASILTRFEYVAQGLGVDELATVILARLSRTSSTGGRSRHTVRWSNAGNPPPILLGPDGRTRLLDPKPDLVVGVDPTYARHDHSAELPEGATLLFYTDGLIERRGASIDDGIADLRAALGDLAGVPLPELFDQVLVRLAPHIGEDDIAMIAVRARP